MLENKKIEDHIRANPEVLVEFNNNHRDILISLRARFEAFIASGDIVDRYLMSRALFEILTIQGQVARQHLQQKVRDQGLNVVDAGDTKH